MNCHQHADKAANGLCKHCQKAVCAACAIDTGGAGLACSEACEQEVRDAQAIIEKSKLIYSIGRKASALNSNVLAYLVLGGLFSMFGALALLGGSNSGWVSLLIGLAFLGIGAYAYNRNRSLNVNI